MTNKSINNQQIPKELVVAITGASGIIYGIRLVSTLLTYPNNIILTLSEGAREVMKKEMGIQPSDLMDFIKNQGVKESRDATLDIRDNHDFNTPSASGSFRHDGMIIVPCSMKTLAQIASGLANNLIARSADVCLKERTPLILVVRETPYNLIHIDNMKKATLAGATILPASPSFYSKPETINDLIDSVNGRILDSLNIHHNLVPPWGASGNEKE